MKPGTRVRLTIDMEELKAGQEGIVAKVEDNKQNPYVWTGEFEIRLGVLFDEKKFPAVCRRMVVKGKEEPVSVISKCVAI